MVLDKGHKLTSSASPMSDVSDISEKLDGIKSEWKKLKEKVTDRAGKLKEANKHAEKFRADMDKMIVWLGLNEETLEKASPVDLDRDMVNKQLKEAQV